MGWLFLCTVLAIGADETELREAKASYFAEKAALKAGLLSKFDEQIATVAATGDLESVLAIKKDREWLEKWNVLPGGLSFKSSVATYLKSEKAAKDELLAEYKKAIASYTKGLELKRAVELKDESLLLSHPADATAFKGKWYKPFPGTISWYGAHKRCENMGGHLPFLDDKDSNAFINKLVPNWKTTWLGAVRLTGKWQWTNGQPLKFTNWNPGEPNNAGTGEECIQFVINGKWNDFPGSQGGTDISGFICQWDE